jgi:hypothetical protein
VAAVGVVQIQNGGRCHGNQGAKNVKFTSNFTKFWIFLAYLVPLAVDVVPIKFHQFMFGE